jgi:N6-adenosine-specific RNA methylase IME4
MESHPARHAHRTIPRRTFILNMRTMRQVLYQNCSQTVTLLDLPHSISEASGLPSVTSAAPTQPFPSTEPKGSKRAKVLSSVPQEEQRYHEQLAELTTAAILEITQSVGQGKWCLDRGDEGMASFRKVDRRTDEPDPQNDLEKGLPVPTSTPAHFTPPLVLSALGNRYDSIAALQNTFVFNPSASVVPIYISERSFLIPSRSVFILSSIQHGSHVFETASKPSGGLPSIINPGLFDLILLDPPWPNRSVRNAQVYKTSERQLELHPFYETLPIISRHLSSSGVAAVWITNKRAIRQLVLRSMRSMGLDLYEEWIWLKTTVYGEPVTALDGLWRKPYEVLLLFSREIALHGSQDELPEYPEVKRRVVIAVPDIHSRKPCLKELLKPLIPQDYRALEIFARNLTAGWWSWGDEVLKFNEEGAI